MAMYIFHGQFRHRDRDIGLGLPIGFEGGQFFVLTFFLGHFLDSQSANHIHQFILGLHLSGTGLANALAMDVPDVLFAYDRSDMSAKFRREVDQLITVMKKYPVMKVEVAGHTDAKGSDSYNQALSKRRANAVRDYMMRNGIEASRIKSVGYGEARPKAPNQNPDGSDNPDGRAKNRRTELSLSK